jgi:hypothetical protein
VTLSDAKDLAEIAGVVVAVITLIKGVYEYTKQAAQNRAEHFIQMRDRYDGFLDVCTLLETDGDDGPAHEELCRMPFERKRDFLGFYEEIALMMQSGLIKREVAHYMFGYYAIRCWESTAFWDAPDSRLNRGSCYWGVFRAFAEEMAKMEKKSMSKAVHVKNYKI